VDRLAPRNIVLATNTSGLSLTAIGERAQHRDRFANLGSLHPVETYRIFKRALAQAKAGKLMFSICIERKFVVK